MSSQIPLIRTGDVTVNGNVIINPLENAGKNLESQNCKIDADSKKWLNDIADAVSSATGNPKYGASTVAREAIIFYRKFYHIRNKLVRYHKAVISLLNNLP